MLAGSGRFYVGCDHCQDWFHGHCVGVTKTEADTMETYVCPNCQEKGQGHPTAQKTLTHDDFLRMLKIVRSLKVGVWACL